MSEVAVSGESQNQGTPGEPTDDALEAIREENSQLVTQIVEAQMSKAEREAQNARNIEYGQLLTENVRLKRELASAEAAATASRVSAGADGLLTQIKENLASAVEQAKAPMGPVDTNSGYVEPEENLPSAGDAEVNEQQDSLPDQTDTTSPTASTPTGVDVDESSVPETPSTPEAPPAVEVPDSVSDFMSPSDSYSDTTTDLGDADGSNQNEE